jgi:hypothetical protein
VTKYIDMIGWDDTPHLRPPHIAQKELDDLEATLLPHQRQARRTGRPALGSGAIYPIQEDDLLCDPLPIPDHWPRAYALDVGWRKTAVLWGAWDRDADVYYLTHEYYRGEREPITHAHAIRSVGRWINGCIDPAAGTSQRDGRNLKAEYMGEELGLNLVNANNAVDAGLHHVLILMQGGQLKTFSTLTSWLTELRLYRRDEKGKIVKTHDHLMDCMRYLLNTPGIWSTAAPRRIQRQGQGEW